MHKSRLPRANLSTTNFIPCAAIDHFRCLSQSLKTPLLISTDSDNCLCIPPRTIRKFIFSPVTHSMPINALPSTSLRYHWLRWGGPPLFFTWIDAVDAFHVQKLSTKQVYHTSLSSIKKRQISAMPPKLIFISQVPPKLIYISAMPPIFFLKL